MKRRSFLGWTLVTLAGTAWVGCRGRQFGRVLDEGQADMVGSHSAGAETYKALVDTAVGRMLGREHDILLASASGPHIPGRRVCFLGVENRSEHTDDEHICSYHAGRESCIDECAVDD